MARVVLYHHALGLTAGVVAFADRLRLEGHEIHTPDLYGGRTFATVADGVAHARVVGFGTLLERGRSAADAHPADSVYAGFSLGVMPAQTRPGAIGALLMYACLPVSEFGDAWPLGVPVQIHGMESDPSFADEGDLDAARDLVTHADNAQLFLYPGDRHLFADESGPDYVPEAAALLMERVLRFLHDVDRR